MSDIIPQWITNLAIDIYKVIQQYDAMRRFQEMVETWARTHESEIQKQIDWKSQRNKHFEKTVGDDLGLQNRQAGPPRDNWQWETSVIHPYEKTESGLKRTDKIISAWVPPQLSISAEPEITHLLPLSREHELTLVEKYTVLAAIYDCARRGTAKIPPWPWPDLSKELGPNGLSNAKKCMFLECLCTEVAELPESDKGWIQTIFAAVTSDVKVRRATESVDVQLKEKTATVTSDTRLDRSIRWGKNHPVISILIFVCIVVIGLGAFTRSLDDIWSFVSKRLLNQSDSETPRANIMDTHILTATATVDITIASDKEGKTEHIMPGTFLAFGKGREALLVMSSKGCTSEQTGNHSVRYSSTMSMDTTSRVFNQPLAILKEAEYVQTCLNPIPPESRILSGKILCVFNGNIPIEIQIPSQEMTSKVITIRNIDLDFEGQSK